MLALLFLMPVLGLHASCASRGGPAPGPGYVPVEGTRLAVIGVANRVADREFRDLRVGFGIQGMLTDALYDTGKFRMVEEKGAIREQLGVTQDRIWEEGIDTGPGALARVAEALGADALAYGLVTSYRVPTSGVSAGIYSRARAVAHLDVHVCIFQRAGGHLFCSTGKGKADHTTDSLFLVYQDDGRLSTKSLIGKASREAIEDALASLLRPR